MYCNKGKWFFPFPFYLTFFVKYDFWNKSLVSNIIYKDSRICSCFPERFYWLHNWASSSKNSKAFSISTAARQIRCKPAFFACNLHSFAIFRIAFYVCYFLSWMMSRSLTSQIITITTKSDNVIFCWELIKVYLLFSRKTCGAETVECFFVLLECSSLLLSALQQNRAKSRLLYFFYDKESVKFPSYCFLFCKTNLIFTANQSVISML